MLQMQVVDELYIKGDTPGLKMRENYAFVVSPLKKRLQMPSRGHIIKGEKDGEIYIMKKDKGRNKGKDKSLSVGAAIGIVSTAIEMVAPASTLFQKFRGWLAKLGWPRRQKVFVIYVDGTAPTSQVNKLIADLEKAKGSKIACIVTDVEFEIKEFELDRMEKDDVILHMVRDA
jgi:hypothetical protein